MEERKTRLKKIVNKLIDLLKTNQIDILKVEQYVNNLDILNSDKKDILKRLRKIIFDSTNNLFNIWIPFDFEQNYYMCLFSLKTATYAEIKKSLSQKKSYIFELNQINKSNDSYSNFKKINEIQTLITELNLHLNLSFNDLIDIILNLYNGIMTKEEIYEIFSDFANEKKNAI